MCLVDNQRELRAQVLQPVYCLAPSLLPNGIFIANTSTAVKIRSFLCWIGRGVYNDMLAPVFLCWHLEEVMIVRVPRTELD